MFNNAIFNGVFKAKTPQQRMEALSAIQAKDINSLVNNKSTAIKFAKDLTQLYKTEILAVGKKSYLVSIQTLDLATPQEVVNHVFALVRLVIQLERNALSMDSNSFDVVKGQVDQLVLKLVSLEAVGKLDQEREEVKCAYSTLSSYRESINSARTMIINWLNDDRISQESKDYILRYFKLEDDIILTLKGAKNE